MKIRWILPAAAGIVALAGAQTGQRSAAAKAPVVRAVEFRNFHDVPVKFLIAEMARRYPSLKGPRGRSAGGMENEAPLATA